MRTTEGKQEHTHTSTQSMHNIEMKTIVDFEHKSTIPIEWLCVCFLGVTTENFAFHHFAVD